MKDIVDLLRLLQEGRLEGKDPESSAALEAIKRNTTSSQYQHIKTGGFYSVLGEAKVQASSGPIQEDDSVTVYQGQDGKLWIRKSEEFQERFVRKE